MPVKQAKIMWNVELADQLDWYWQYLFRPRLDGLTDDEYLWQPVEGCWTVRPAGDGTFTLDSAHPQPDPPPVTTIAWRLCHIGGGVLGVRASNHFGDGSLREDSIEWPGTALDAIAFVDDAYKRWSTGVRELGEGGLARPCGPAEGPYADHSLAALILHINREVFHHGAEVALLRDLYRASDGGRAWRAL